MALIIGLCTDSIVTTQWKDRSCLTMSKFKFILLPVLLLLSVSTAWAEKDPVTVVMEAHKVSVDDKGKEHLNPADEAKPADIVEYKATYTNNTDHGISNLLATVPIPAGMVFQDSNYKPSRVMATIDGKAYKAVPLMRKVQLADGSWKKVKVPLSEYRSLQWKLGKLKAKSEKVVSARMKVEE